MKLVIIISTLWLVHSGNGQRIQYLGGLDEGELCEFEQGRRGICTKASKCLDEFEHYKKNESILKVCKYNKATETSIVCCPQKQFKSKISRSNLIDFAICRNEYLKYRKSEVNIAHFAKAFSEGKVPKNQENCDKINTLGVPSVNFWDTSFHHCLNENGFNATSGFLAFVFNGKLVQKGDRPNMAAIGVTQANRTINYICGGSIITENFIVTAAHCKYFKGKIPDTIRVGDRYLVTKEDDELAQQLNVKEFINHPQYTSKYAYNDIALIKTVESITFNKFVVPSCIADLDEIPKGRDTTWTAAGYGQTEDYVPSNILLQISVGPISNEKCNEFYSDYDNLPNGIIDSQLCVNSFPDTQNDKAVYSDTCFGDSGSPLQYKTTYEVFPADFNKTFLSNFYLSSNVIGIVSFGVSCGLDAPSVYTKLSYYRDWMKTVIENN